MTEYSSEDVADLLGDDLAARLDLDDGPYSDADLDALTEALEDAAALADRVADGDVAALATLLSPAFLRSHSEFESFADFLGASPWGRDAVADAFAGRANGESEPAAATTSSFLSRTTSFRTPGEMVQVAVVHRCKHAIQADDDEGDNDDGSEGDDEGNDDTE